MITLIVGTPDSGKSLLAETITLDKGKPLKKYYIATMIPYGEEGKRRVNKHRNMRDGKGFITLEWPDDLEKRVETIDDFEESVVLLECMSNLIGNEMYSESNVKMSEKQISDKVIGAILKLSERTSELILVTNEFPMEDEKYDEDTRKYVRLVAEINSRLIEIANTIFVHRNGEWVLYEDN